MWVQKGRRCLSLTSYVFPISYFVLWIDRHYCLRTPMTLGRLRTDSGAEEGREAPSARKTAMGSLYHFLNAWCTPRTEHGLQQVRHWKSSLGQIVNYSICVCVYKNPFSPRPPLLLPPLLQKRKKNKFRKRLPRASASWREPLPDKSPNQTVGFLCKP